MFTTKNQPIQCGIIIKSYNNESGVLTGYEEKRWDGMDNYNGWNGTTEELEQLQHDWFQQVIDDGFGVFDVSEGERKLVETDEENGLITYNIYEHLGAYIDGEPVYGHDGIHASIEKLKEVRYIKPWLEPYEYPVEINGRVVEVLKGTDVADMGDYEFSTYELVNEIIEEMERNCEDPKDLPWYTEDCEILVYLADKDRNPHGCVSHNWAEALYTPFNEIIWDLNNNTPASMVEQFLQDIQDTEDVIVTKVYATLGAPHSQWDYYYTIDRDSTEEYAKNMEKYKDIDTDYGKVYECYELERNHGETYLYFIGE